jgi:hypothetical protein
MKSSPFAAAVAAVLLAAAATHASAAQSISFAATAPDGSFTGMFGNTAIAGGAFTDTFNFSMPTGVAGITISSNFTTDQITISTSPR